MKFPKQIYNCIWLLFFTGSACAQSGDPSFIQPVETNEEVLKKEEISAVSLRSIEEKKWEKAIDGTDYSKDLPRERKPRNFDFERPDATGWTEATAWWGKMLQIVVVLLAAAGLAWLLYKNLQAPRNRQIAADGVEITAFNVEDYLHESDLRKFFNEALSAGDYALALRFRFLWVLQTFSEKSLIEWSREKTNREYARELQFHPAYGDFQTAVRIYEIVWFGKRPVDRAAFERYMPAFEKLGG